MAVYFNCYFKKKQSKQRKHSSSYNKMWSCLSQMNTEMDRWIWTHGNVSIVPTDTFTPAAFYTSGTIGQGLLNGAVNKQHKVTFCFSGPHTALFTLIRSFFNQHHPTWLQTTRSQSILRFLWQIRLVSPPTLFFLSSFIDTTYKNGLSLPELQTPPPLFYFSSTYFHQGLITWWTE